VTLLALIFLTEYFYYIPKACLSSVLICAVIFMVRPNDNLLRVELRNSVVLHNRVKLCICKLNLSKSLLAIDIFTTHRTGLRSRLELFFVVFVFKQKICGPTDINRLING
jgi:hypothetical protein